MPLADKILLTITRQTLELIGFSERSRSTFLDPAYSRNVAVHVLLSESEAAVTYSAPVTGPTTQTYLVGASPAYATELNDPNRALDLVEESLSHLGVDHIRHANADPDIESLRGHPRYSTMIRDAKLRLGVQMLTNASGRKG